MVEGAYDKVSTKKVQVCEWHNRFRDGRVSVKFRTADDRQLRERMKTWSVWAMPHEVTEKRALRR
jgi:hypothetical protein